MGQQAADILRQELEAYKAAGLYPFHMPGHKRRISPAEGLPIGYDLTEVEGVDDLHHAQGILREAMERTAALFGADKTWYLVGGSTVGNLAGIRAAVPYGSEVIVARNCHKSVYHAIELGNLRVHWIWPDYDRDYDIYGSIQPAVVQDALRRFPASAAVILTSPTYEGVLSDISSIAGICHGHFCKDPGNSRMGIPLIVDEAHGAHLGLFREGGFPQSAIRCGADVVVQSAHKTLPSLTQTALLHLHGTLVDPDEIEQQLNVFETSSPSYPLMVSLDGCTGLLREHGRELFAGWGAALDAFDAALTEEPLHHLRVLCHGEDKTEGGPAVFAYDRSKILISCKGCSLGSHKMSGDQLAAVLRNRYHLETEMHLGDNVLCMTSCADDYAMYRALYDALREIDRSLEDSRSSSDSAHEEGYRERQEQGEREEPLPIGEALRQPMEWVPAAKSAGRLAGEYIYPYPPGIPVIVPGEEITQGNLQLLRCWQGDGAQIIHTGGREQEGIIRVVAGRAQ